MAAALFRFIAALGRTMVVANTMASFALLVLLVLSGFVLSHRNALGTNYSPGSALNFKGKIFVTLVCSVHDR